MDEHSPIGTYARGRAEPSASTAAAATGAIALAVGLFLVTIHLYSHGHGRGPSAACFLALLVAGYAASWFAPEEIRPAAVTAVVIAVPVTLGWWFFPHAHRFADVRPVFVLSIVVWAACWAAPRTRGRVVFVGAIALVLWLWMLGEIVVTGPSVSVSSPPTATLTLPSQLGTNGGVSFGDLDPSSPLYPVARQCLLLDASACDSLYASAPVGSDFQSFADTCAGREPVGSGGQCTMLEPGSLGLGALPAPTTPQPRLSFGGGDKTTEVGFVSLFFGAIYLGALILLDRSRMSGLATAFALPGLAALVTGAESLGSATHHAWAVGLFLFVAGMDVAILGDYTRRRFTTWAGALIAALGAVVIALDASDLSGAFASEHVRLLRPGLTVMAFSVGVIAFAWVVARVRARHPGTTPPPLPPPPPSPSAGAPLVPPAPAPTATPFAAPPTPSPPPFER